MHVRLAEVIVNSTQASAATSTAQETARGYSEATRRYLRSIELCDNYLRGYYGLKLVTRQLLDIIPTAGSGEGILDQSKVELLNEVSTLKLWEIVRSSSQGLKGWEGNDKSELIATRELLDRDELNELGDATSGR